MIRKLLAVVILTFVFAPTFSNAQLKEPDWQELMKDPIAIPDKDSNEDTIVSVLKFSSGVAFSYLAHEASHFLVAKVTNTEMDFKVGTDNQLVGFEEHSNTRSKGLAINSAGLISHLVSSEVILDVNGIDKNGQFVRGVMAWNIVNPIMYSLDYWFIHSANKLSGGKYQGDISGIEYYSSKDIANGYALSISAIAAFQGYRFLKTQSWAPDWLKTDYRVSLAPLPSGGFVLGYEYKF
jgi:hypothetical protein